MQKNILPQNITANHFIDSFSEGVIIINTNSIIIFANKKALTMFGYAENELPGMELAVLIPDDFKHMHRLQELLYFESPQTRPMGLGISLFGKRKNGEEFPVEISLSYIRAENETCVMAFISDISRRYKLERELVEKNSDLEAFASMLSHDLNSLLSGMVGFSDFLLSEETITNEKHRNFLEIISQNSKKASTIVKEILLLTKISNQTLTKTQVQIKPVLQSALERNKELISEFSSEIDISGEFDNVLSYGPWLEEVFYNLISNGIKYGGVPPKIRIYQENEKEAWVRIVFSDNGSGISDDMKDKILLENNETKRKIVQGHGIGLPMVNKIVTKLGGKLEINDNSARGTNFCISLPQF